MGAHTVKDWDLGKGLTLKNMKVPNMQVKVVVELDPKFEKMAARAEESLLLQQMSDAATDVLGPIRDSMHADLKKLDADFANIRAKNPKIVEVTQFQIRQKIYVGGKEAEKAVNKVWTSYTSSRAAYKGFKLKCVAKYVMGTLAVVASTLSLIVSGGAAVTGYIGIAKAVAEIALTAESQAASVQKIHDELAGRMVALNQTIDKEKSRFRQVVSDLSPIMSLLMNSLKICDTQCNTLHAKVGEARKPLNTLVGRLNQGLAEHAKLEKSYAHKAPELKNLREQNRRLINQVIEGNAALEDIEKNRVAWRKWIDEAKKKRNSGATKAIQGASVAKALAGLGALAKASLDMALKFA